MRLVFIFICFVIFKLESSNGIFIQKNLTEVNEKMDRHLNVLEKGVHNLYDGTTQFLGFIHRKIISDYYQNFGLFPSQNSKDGIDYGAVINYLSGFVGFAILCFILAIAVPIIAVIVCCCRMKGRCGRENQPLEKSQDKYQRLFLSIFMILLVALSFTCLTFAFTSNNILAEQLSPTSEDGFLHRSIKSIQMIAEYRDSVIKDLKFLKSTAYNVSSLIINTLEKVPVDAVTFFEKTTNWNWITDSKSDIQSNLTEARSLLLKSKEKLQKYFELESKAIKHLDDLRFDLKTELKKNHDDWKISSNLILEPYPNPTNLLSNVKHLWEQFLKAELSVRNNFKDSENIFQYKSNEIKERITDTVSVILNEARTGQSKILVLDKFMKKLQALPINRTVVSLTTPPLSNMFYNYENIRMGTYLSVCLLLASVFGIFILAIVIAWLRGPSVQNKKKKHCDAETASSSLVLAIGLGIVLFSMITVLITFLFLAGGITYTEFCRYANPDLSSIGDTPLAEVVDTTVNELFLNGTDFYNTSVIDAIKYCKNDSAIYTALQLESKFQLKVYLEVQNRMEMAKDLFLKIQNETTPILTNFTSLSDNTILSLRKVSQISLSSLNTLTDELEILKSLDHNIRKVRDELNDTKKVKDVTKYDSFRHKILEYNKHDLKNLKDEAVGSSDSLKEFVKHIGYEKIREGSKSKFREGSESKFQEDVLNFVNSVLNQDKHFNHETEDDINEMMKSTGAFALKKMMSIYDIYKNHFSPIKSIIFDQIGKCGTLYESLDSLVTYTCTNPVYSFNAYWAGIAATLLLLLPSFAASSALVILFRRQKKSHDGYQNYFYKNIYNAIEEKIMKVKPNQRKFQLSKKRKEMPLIAGDQSVFKTCC